MPNVLIHGDTVRYPTMRHEIPLMVPDPFLYVEVGGQRLSCEPYEQAGLPTQLSKAPGQVLEEGYFHSLGHGVGLDVHEAPLLGRAPDVLVAGDVITLEPGCYRPGFGGCRLEDLVLVTDDGAELLTDFPYDLEP
jgi:Xaa-Pro aminopeptidase